MHLPLRPSLALALVALAGGCHRDAAPPDDTPAPVVSGNHVTYPAHAPQLAYLATEPAAPRLLAVQHLTGRLYLAEDATVRIFTPVAGQVSGVLADVGQKVAAGAPLAEIRSPDFDQALSDARSANAAAVAAEKALARERDLLDHGAAAQKDVDAAEAAAAAAEAERARAAGRLKLYHGSPDGQDEAYVLRTPFAGVVVERNINPGQEVRADQMLANANTLVAPLFVVSNPDRLWVQVDAADSDLPELRAGEAIRVTTNAFPGEVFPGTLANIGQELDPASRAVRVRGVVDNPGHRLMAEMYVAVDVVRDESRVAGAGVDVPAPAIFTVDQAPYLFVETAPGDFERRSVKVGAERDGKVQVTAGVKPGERVVAEGALLLQSVLSPSS
jgi:cobalt-zinc-cadmium efflux system membrane fusion protein